VVDDDVAVKDSFYTAGRRGVANTVLIEKLVGAAAERGDSLEACAELGRKLNNQGHSIGIALAPVPFRPPDNRRSPYRITRWSSASVSTANRASTAALHLSRSNRR
jgi:hypothetical protein